MSDRTDRGAAATPSAGEAAPAPATIEVVEYTDPGCVWSWGSEPQLRRLRHLYGDQLTWRRVLGVQVDRLAETHPDRDAVADAEAFRADWLAVAEHTGAPVPAHLDRMHRSTRPASHAVRAAERQGAAGDPGVADRVLRRLREAVFVHGRPADTPERIAAALTGGPGLDLPRLLADLDDPEVVASVQADWEETRRPHAAVIGRTGPGPNPGAAKPDGDRLRYGFPTLILRGPAGEEVVSGWNDADALARAVQAVGGHPAEDPGPIDPDEALARHGTLTVADLRLTTGDREPASGTRVDTASTAVWLHPDAVAAGEALEAVRAATPTGAAAD